MKMNFESNAFHKHSLHFLTKDPLPFLFMSLVPAVLWFQSLLGYFLRKNETFTSSVKLNETHFSLLKSYKKSTFFTTSVYVLSPHFSMLRSVSLQNFSTNCLNIFPEYVEEDEKSHSCEKDLINNHQKIISVMEDSLKIYESDVSVLENNIQILKEKEDSSTKYIHKLEHKVSNLGKQLKQKECELSEANKKVQNYHKYYCWSLVQITNLMKEEHSLRDENINLLLLVEEYCSDNEYCEDKLREYQQNLNVIEKDMCLLTVDIEKRNRLFEDEKNQMSVKISNLENENEKLKVQCEVQDSELEKYNQMVELYKRRIEQIKELLDSKTKEIQCQDERIKGLETCIQDALSEKSDLLVKMANLDDQTKSLTVTNKNLVEQKAHLEKLISNKNDEMSTVCAELDSTQQQLCKSGKEITDLKDALNHLKDKVDVITVEHDLKLKEKDDELSNLKQSSQQYEIRLKEEVMNLAEHLERTKDTIERLDNETRMLQTELKCKNELSKVFEDQHQRLNMSYEALYKEFSETMTELNVNKKEVMNLKEIITETKAENESLQKLESQFKQREQKFERDVEEKVRAFEIEILNKNEEIMRLENIIQDHTQQIQQFEKEIETKDLKMNEKLKLLESKKNDVKSQHENYQNCLAKWDSITEKENAKEIMSLIEINSAHCKRQRALENAYRDLSLECKALHQKLKSLAENQCEHCSNSTECEAQQVQFQKLLDENRELHITVADYKKINDLLLDQIKCSVQPDSGPIQDDSFLLPHNEQPPDKEDPSCSHSTLSAEDRNVDLWWENEVSLSQTINYTICSETKSL